MPCPICADLSNYHWKVTRGPAIKRVLPRQLEKSAAKGCEGCSIIVKGFQRLSSSWEASVKANNRYIWSSSDGNGPLRLTLQHPRHHLEIFAAEEPPVNTPSWPGLGTGGIVPPNTGHKESLEKLRAWLRQCRDQHPACATTGYGLPRRVIDIGSASDPSYTIRLYESRRENKEYICLSYRWPRIPRAQLLRSNIRQYKVAIPSNELPLTFKEVFTVARALGVRYVWIDALCIIQDDDGGDKAQDLATMDLIYKSAALTIFSAWSTDKLFSSLGERYRHHEAQSRGRRSPRQRILFRRALPHHFCDDDAKAALPIMNRAWIFQERMLSRRAVYFTEHELIWDCQTSLRCQCRGSRRHDERHTMSADFFRTLYRIFVQATGDSLADGSRHFSLSDLSDLWWTCVEEYSQLKMTNPGDRLNAIQGVAAAMQAKGHGIGGEYLSGLWENALVRDLCWRCPDQGPKPKPRRAPTWSWGNTDLRILGELPGEIKAYVAEAKVANTTSNSSRSRGFAHGSVLSIRTVVVDAKMRCRSSNGNCRYSFGSPGTNSFFAASAELGEIGGSFFEPDHDGSEHRQSSRSRGVEFKIRLLKMLEVEEEYGRTGVSGIWLVVKRVGDPGSNLHQRVGFWKSQMREKSWTRRFAAFSRDREERLLKSGRRMEVLLE